MHSLFFLHIKCGMYSLLMVKCSIVFMYHMMTVTALTVQDNGIWLFDTNNVISLLESESTRISPISSTEKKKF